MKKHALLLAIIAVASFFVLGCAAGQGLKMSKLRQETPDIQVSQITKKTRKGEINFLCAKVGSLHIVDTKSGNFTETEKVRFKEIARSIRDSDTEERLKNAVAKCIPQRYQGGEIAYGIGDCFWRYFSPKKEIYYMVCSPKDPKRFFSGEWTREPPTLLEAFVRMEALYQESIEESEEMREHPKKLP
jgi:hypothetical protein